MANFIYIIGDKNTRECVIVDPAWDIDGILKIIEVEEMKIKGSLVKHYHPDHVGGSIFGMNIKGLAELMEKNSSPVYVNKHEAVVLKAMGGSGTVNAVTGLREYWGGDDPAPAPAPAGNTTVTQVSDLPEYFKPYVEELFATSQDVYEKPYVPYGHQLVKGEDGSYTTEAIEDFEEIVDDGINGYIIERKNIEQIIDKISLFYNNRNMIEKFGKGNIDRAIKSDGL